MRPPTKRLTALFFIFIFIFISTGVAFGAPEVKQEDKEEKKKKVEVTTIKYVFVIGIEGMDKRDLTSAPNISGLGSAGIRIPDLVSVKPEQFSVAVASLLTGLDPSNHKYFIQGDKFPIENLFAIYEKSNRKVLLVDGTEEKLDDLGKITKIYKGNVSGPKAVVDEATKTFPKELPYLTTLLLTLNKNSTIKKIDQEMGRFFSFLHQQGIFEQSLIVITGIEGQGGFAFLKGPGFKGGVNHQNALLIDLFPTIIKVTDGKVPIKVDGLVLWNALKAGEGYTELNLLQKRVNELSESESELTKLLYKAREDRRLALENQRSMRTDKQKVQSTLGEKDKEIRLLQLKISAMKLIGLFMVLGFGVGYVIEYFILRKRFLMF